MKELHKYFGYVHVCAYTYSSPVITSLQNKINCIQVRMTKIEMAYVIKTFNA